MDVKLSNYFLHFKHKMISFTLHTCKDSVHSHFGQKYEIPITRTKFGYLQLFRNTIKVLGTNTLKNFLLNSQTEKEKSQQKLPRT